MANPVPRGPENLRHKSILTRSQSGDDWGMEDLDDYFGTDISNMDPHSQEFEDAMAAQTGDPPKLGGEIEAGGWSPDFTDSGIQSDTDPEDAEIDAYEKSLITKKRSMGASNIPLGGGGTATGATRRKVEKKSALTRKV